MHPVRSLRTLVAGLALAASLPALAQEYDAPPPPPPPDQLPWAPPARPEPPPPPRARPPQPVYRPDAVYGPYGQRDARHLAPERSWDGQRPGAPWGPPPVFEPRVEFALHGGVASPGGTAFDGMPMADLFGEQLVIGAELGVRTTPNLSLQLFAEGGVGNTGSGWAASCAPGGRCDTSSAVGRLGVGLRYHLAPYQPIDPWVGYAVAVSGAVANGDDALGSFSRTLTGVEYAKLSVGADLRLAHRSAIGLYAEWTSGIFTEAEDRQGGAVVDSGRISGTSTHSWFTVGPRLTF